MSKVKRKNRQSLQMVATGNPVDGFLYYGPFDDFDSAVLWAEEELRGSSDAWWVCDLLAIA